MNSLQNQASAPVSMGVIESLMRNSTLLFPETKTTLLSYLQNSNDPNEYGRIVDFLGNEKTFILTFMKRRLHEGDFPEKIALLFYEMQSKFLRELRARERSELEHEKTENVAENILETAFAC